jgi:hypothetical protein
MKHYWQQVRTLIEKGWVKAQYAMNKNGEAVDENDESACAFCISGAMQKVLHGNETRTSDYLKMHLALSKKVKTQFITHWNDAGVRTKEDVLRVIDELINE